METAWNTTSEKKSYPKLTEDLEVDVAIVGGGLTGIQSAYLLGQQGLKTAVFEKGTLGNYASAHTTAFITCVIDTSLSELVSMFGRQKARLVWNSGLSAIDAIENLVKKEKI